MKTIREWLEELPEPYREQALGYCDAELLSRTVEDFLMAINSFTWEDTKEGTQYWQGVEDFVLNGGPLPATESPTNALSALHAIALKEGFLVEEIESVMRPLGIATDDTWKYRLVGNDAWHLINLKTDK